MLTLLEKEDALMETVAMPTVEDWQPYFGDYVRQDIVDRANEILVDTLTWTKAQQKKKQGVTWGKIGERIYGPIHELEAEVHVGLTDSEGYMTVARFFAINLDPSMYRFLRDYGASE
jgi:hypothetical protein